MLLSAVSSRPRSASSRCCASRFCRVICLMIRNRIKRDHRRSQRCRDDQEPGLFAPVGERGGNRVGCDHDARVVAERGCRSQPVRLVDRALHAQRLRGAALPDPLQQRRLREILADQFVDPRIARQHGAVGMKHRDGGAGSERDGSKEFFVVERVDAPRHHAEEDAVFASQSMGDDGIQIAVEIAANRLGQNGWRSRIEFEALEIAPLGNVEGGCRQRPRPVDHVAIGIEDGDVAEIGQDAGLGSQDLMRFGASRHASGIPSPRRCRKFAAGRSRRRRACRSPRTAGRSDGQAGGRCSPVRARC